MALDGLVGPAITAVCLFVGLIVYIVRLEARVKRVEERHDELREDFRDFTGGPVKIERLPSRREK